MSAEESGAQELCPGLFVFPARSAPCHPPGWWFAGAGEVFCARSHLDDDRVVVWHPDGHLDDYPEGALPGPSFSGVARIAVDAERLAQPVPRALRSQYDAADDREFWFRWTRAEVLAKLTDTPILTMLGSHGLPPVDGPDAASVSGAAPGAHLDTVAISGLAVTCGWISAL